DRGSAPGPCPRGTHGASRSHAVDRARATVAVASGSLRRCLRGPPGVDLPVGGAGDLPERRLRVGSLYRRALPSGAFGRRGGARELPLVHDAVVRAGDALAAGASPGVGGRALGGVADRG